MAKNKDRTSEFDKFLEDVRGKHSKRLNAILLTQSKDDEAEFTINYFKALEYAAPKLQRTEVVQEEVEQTITIEHVYPKEKE